MSLLSKKGGLYIFLFLNIFLLTSIVSAYEPHQQDKNYTHSLTVANSDSCNITVITYPSGDTAFLNIPMDKVIFDFTANISSGNFSQIGDTCWDILCYDSDATPQYIDGTKCLTVTLSGSSQDIPGAMANILVISFLILLITAIFIVTRKIDYDRWYNSLVNKYENKNYIKLVLSAIGFNTIKNTFVIYYLLCLPLLMSITNLVYDFGIVGMIDIMRVFLGIYTIGAIIVGIYFFGFVQEWIMNLMEELKDLDWGVEK